MYVLCSSQDGTVPLVPCATLSLQHFENCVPTAVPGGMSQSCLVYPTLACSALNLNCMQRLKRALVWVLSIRQVASC